MASIWHLSSTRRILVALICWAVVVWIFSWSRLSKDDPTPVLDQQGCGDDPLHFSSNCDLRLYYLEKLQRDRREWYGEDGDTITKPINILFFTTIEHYDRFMDRWWYFRYDAALRHPYINPIMWGPGWQNYSYRESLKENLVRVYGSVSYFQIINVFNWGIEQQIQDISNQTVILEMHDEAWCRPEGCTDYIPAINATLVGFAYPTEILIQQWQDISDRRVHFHIPKTVCAERMYAPPDTSVPPPSSLEEAVAAYDAARDIDVLIIGSIHRYVYPFRWKVACTIMSGYFNDTGINHYIHKHPGYTEREKEFMNITLSLNQIDEFATYLRRAKVVVSDSSRFHYGVGKYAEIPASGALLVGDIPDEREEDFTKFVVKLDVRTPNTKIIETLQYWLDHPVERYQRARLGQSIILNKYTNDHSIDIILQAYFRLKRHQFGNYFPYPFSNTCRSLAPTIFSPYCSDPDMSLVGFTPETGADLKLLNCPAKFN